jgi:hypothetical protein
MAIDYAKFVARPTVFNGVQYRSRLEAKWAAFFTALGWEFQYEPFDLADWVPDFHVSGRPGLLVEVKPVTEFDQQTAERIFHAAGSDERELLLVGFAPRTAPWFSGLRVGWMTDKDWLEDSNQFNTALVTGITKPDGPNKEHRFGIISEEMSFADRISGIYDGDRHLNNSLDHTLPQIWAKACNDVQWIPGRK